MDPFPPKESFQGVLPDRGAAFASDKLHEPPEIPWFQTGPFVDREFPSNARFKSPVLVPVLVLNI